MDATIHIASDRAGTASIIVDPVGAILFPATVAISAPNFEADVSGTIIQVGTHTVYVTINGITDTVTIEVIALPNNVMIGPETSLDYEGLPITFNLVASCDRPNTLITLSSVGTGITLPDPPQVLVDGPPVEFPVTISNYGEFEVTGVYGLDSSTCHIHSINDAIKLYLEADRDIYVEDLPVTFNMRVFCSRDGTVTLSSTGTGMTIPDHIEVVLGMGEFSITIATAGLKIIGALFDATYTECALDVSEEAILISLGEDRHVYYNGTDITITKTVYCNKDGLVTLTQTGDVVDIPSDVTIVDGTAEFDIICHGAGTTLIEAEMLGVPTQCQIIVSEAVITLSLGTDRSFDFLVDPITFNMNIYCSRDGMATITSDHATIVPANVNIINGIGTFSVTCTETSVITANFATASDTCNITVNYISTLSDIGPDQELFLRYQQTLTPKLMVTSNRPATIPITSAAGFPASVTVDGTEEITGSITAEGTYPVTTPYDSTTIIVTKEPNVVRIGPDATNEPVLHVSTNWPGVVTLLVAPDYGYTLPVSVTVDSTLEADVVGEFLVFGDYVVTATFGASTDTCEVSYVTDDTTGCYVTGTIKDMGGQPVRDAEVVFKPVPVTQTLTSGILSRSAKIARTARDGTFSIRLLRGSTVIAVCDKISLRKTFTVPDQATVDIEDV